MPFKKGLTQPPCGAIGDKGRLRSGPSGTPPFREAFPAAGPRLGSSGRGEGQGAARGAHTALRGQEANIKTTKIKKKKKKISPTAERRKSLRPVGPWHTAEAVSLSPTGHEGNAAGTQLWDASSSLRFPECHCGTFLAFAFIGK